MAERIDVAALLSKLYLPETTFASQAEKMNGKNAVVTHTLSEAQCSPRKTNMLIGEIKVDGKTITNTRMVDDEITKGHFITQRLLAGHQGFGMLLAAGSYDHPMWWTEVDSISFQSPAVPGDEVIAIATITQDNELGRIVNGRVIRGPSAHTRARKIQLEYVEEGDFSRPHLPQNAWLEIAAHFGGGALAALGEFPIGDYAPIYLGVGKSSLPKELALPGDKLTGRITLNSVEELSLPDIGIMKVVSVDEIITKGTSGIWRLNQVEFGFLLREQLEALLKNGSKN